MEHDWVLACAIPLTKDQILDVLAVRQIELGSIDQSRLKDGGGIACWVCEQDLSAEKFASDCPGQPSGYHDDGTPTGWTGKP